MCVQELPRDLSRLFCEAEKFSPLGLKDQNQFASRVRDLSQSKGSLISQIHNTFLPLRRKMLSVEITLLLEDIRSAAADFISINEGSTPLMRGKLELFGMRIAKLSQESSEEADKESIAEILKIYQAAKNKVEAFEEVLSSRLSIIEETPPRKRLHQMGKSDTAAALAAVLAGSALGLPAALVIAGGWALKRVILN